MIERLRGVFPPLVTPFTQDDTVDEASLKAIVRFLTPHVHGLFVCGTYGGGPLMNVDERRRVLEIVRREAGDTLRVTAHVGATNLRDSLHLARHAEQVGAALIASLPPYYYTHPERDVEFFYRSLVDAVGIPVYVYNNPRAVGYGVSPDLVRKLAGLGVRGIKDSSFDILVLAKFLRQVKEPAFDVVLGTEAMFTAASALGIQAFIPGLGNAFPELCRALYDAAQAGDYGKARGVQETVDAVRDVMYEAGSSLVAVLAMLEIRGICRTLPRPPFLPVEASALETMRQRLRDLKVL